MTGEQKPGGLEVVGCIRRSKGGTSWTFMSDPEDVKFYTTEDRPERYDVVALTPAEPAEARIRSLEAKLARAVEGLKTARETLDAFDCALTTDRPVAGAARRAVKRIDQTLAALQQEGE